MISDTSWLSIPRITNINYLRVFCHCKYTWQIQIEHRSNVWFQFNKYTVRYATMYKKRRTWKRLSKHQEKPHTHIVWYQAHYNHTAKTLRAKKLSTQLTLSKLKKNCLLKFGLQYINVVSFGVFLQLIKLISPTYTFR